MASSYDPSSQQEHVEAPVKDVCGCVFFFFQAEDGIRDLTVTGVQTCALPICVAAVREDVEPRAAAPRRRRLDLKAPDLAVRLVMPDRHADGVHVPMRDVPAEIGRASCRERV